MGMYENRRDFLKTAGLVASGMISTGLTRKVVGQPPRDKQKSVMGLKVLPLETVRVAGIGLGRGGGHIRHLMKMEGVVIKALCDIHEPRAKGLQKAVVDAGLPEPEIYTQGEYDYRRLLARDDIDIVIIGTPWRWHTPMCIEAMQMGKHAFTEVPAAVTLEECWQLVDTAERTGKHCMMLENVCYGREELMALNLCRQGVLGELLHGEAAYIHDLRGQMRSLDHGTGSWRTIHHMRRNGNLYPTHGLGPVAQYMSINRGDRFDYLSSMSSPALGRALYAKKHFPSDHARNQATYICGDMNTSLIKTVKGRSVMVQWDTTTPRPYTRLNLIQGTNGCLAGYPNRIVVEGRGNTHSWQAFEDYYEEFDHPLWKRMGELAAEAGGHGGMDFLMLWRVIYCLRNGEPLDQDVYDAASWSAVGPLSEQSVGDRSSSVDFPDFTRGAWKTATPLGIVS